LPVETPSDADWDGVLASPYPVLVGFWADWCVPSRALLADFDVVTARYPSLRAYRVNVDQQPAAAARHDVKGLPTILLFKGGQPLVRRVGLVSREHLLTLLAPVV
jgi:thioredoxin-like negative regulator of GroEL